MPERRVRAYEGPQMGEAHVLFISHRPTAACLMNEIVSVTMPKAGFAAKPKFFREFSTHDRDRNFLGNFQDMQFQIHVPLCLVSRI